MAGINSSPLRVGLFLFSDRFDHQPNTEPESVGERFDFRYGMHFINRRVVFLKRFRFLLGQCFVVGHPAGIFEVDVHWRALRYDVQVPVVLVLAFVMAFDLSYAVRRVRLYAGDAVVLLCDSSSLLS